MKLLFPKIQSIPFFKEVFNDLIVSKAFCMSTKTKPDYFQDTKPLFTLSVQNVKQEFLENDLRNPDCYLYIKFYSCLEKLQFDYEQLSL